MRTEALIHWLSASVRHVASGIDDAVEQFYAAVPGASRQWVSTTALHGYRYAARNTDGARVEIGRDDMGVHVELSGEALERLAAGGTPAAVIIDAFVRMTANFARLDISVDVFQSTLSIQLLEDQFLAGRCQTKARYSRTMRDNVGGHTLYLGHPSSTRQLRVYNKAAERHAKGEWPDEDEWIRIELQLRDEAAHSAAHMLTGVMDGARTIRALIVQFADFPDDRVWNQALKHTSIAIGASRRKRTNTRRWLLGVVAAAYARELRLDKSFEVEFMRSVSAALAGLDKSGS